MHTAAKLTSDHSGCTHRMQLDGVAGGAIVTIRCERHSVAWSETIRPGNVFQLRVGPADFPTVAPHKVWSAARALD